MKWKDFLQMQILYIVQFVGASMMGKGNTGVSNLDVIKELCDELEGFFESYVMDRVWSQDNSKVTICFTAEKIRKSRYVPVKQEPFRY